MIWLKKVIIRIFCDYFKLELLNLINRKRRMICEHYDLSLEQNIHCMNHNAEKERYYFEKRKTKIDELSHVDKKINIYKSVLSSLEIIEANEIKVDSSSNIEFISPFFAKLILIFTAPSKSLYEAMLGDLEEEYKTNVMQFGRRNAQYIYWMHIIKSIHWKVISHSIKKYLLKFKSKDMYIVGFLA